MANHDAEFWQQHVDVNLTLADVLELRSLLNLARRHPDIPDRHAQHRCELLIGYATRILIERGAIDGGDSTFLRTPPDRWTLPDPNP